MGLGDWQTLVWRHEQCHRCPADASASLHVASKHGRMKPDRYLAARQREENFLASREAVWHKDKCQPDSVLTQLMWKSGTQSVQERYLSSVRAAGRMHVKQHGTISKSAWQMSLAGKQKACRPSARCHAHAKATRVRSNATPATQSSPRQKPDQAHYQSQPSAISATPATEKKRQCHQAPLLPPEGASNLCVKQLCVKELRVRILCVKELCVCVWKSCVWQRCVWKSCVWERGGKEEEEGEEKRTGAHNRNTRTPHKDVGKTERSIEVRESADEIHWVNEHCNHCTHHPVHLVLQGRRWMACSSGSAPSMEGTPCECRQMHSWTKTIRTIQTCPVAGAIPKPKNIVKLELETWRTQKLYICYIYLL